MVRKHVTHQDDSFVPLVFSGNLLIHRGEFSLQGSELECKCYEAKADPMGQVAKHNYAASYVELYLEKIGLW